MEEKKTIFDYLGRIFCSFGISMVAMMILCAIFGKFAYQMSTMFQLQDKGMALETMWQFLCVNIFIELSRILFFADGLIKGLSMTTRAFFMFILDFIIMAVFILLFGWFPATHVVSWVLFIICFSLSILISVSIMNWRERVMNQKMEEGLNRLKKSWEEEENR